MNNLVILKGKEVFTDSLIITKGTGIAHRKIKEAIRRHKEKMERFGLLVSYQTESTGGRPEELYHKVESCNKNKIGKEYKSMTKKDKFIKNMAKTGEVTSIEWIVFLLEHYFMKDLALQAYKEELVVDYGYSETYALACYEDAKKTIKGFIKSVKQNHLADVSLLGETLKKSP